MAGPSTAASRRSGGAPSGATNVSVAPNQAMKPNQTTSRAEMSTEAPAGGAGWSPRSDGSVGHGFSPVSGDRFPVLETCNMQVTTEGSILACNMQVTRTARRALKAPLKRAHGFARSPCPIASALDVVGDKWSLLVVRDMLRGKQTYNDLLASPERIPTNLLAERLARLERAGLISRSAYQRRPVRYAYVLTDKGKGLAEVLKAYVQWGKRHIAGTRTLGEIQSEP